MIDPFILLTPSLLLGVFLLVRFIGCNAVYGLNQTTLSPSQPVILSISPTFATQGDFALTLTVIGSNFVHDSQSISVVQWNGSDRPTTFISQTELVAQVASVDIAIAGTAQVTVFTKGAEPMPTSNAVPFTVDSSDVIVHLDNRTPPGNADDPFNGVFQNLDFGAGKWFWQGAAAGNSIYIGPTGDNGPHTGNFSFVNTPPTGRRLLRIRVLADPILSGTITIQDGVNPPVMQSPVPAGAPPTFIETGWGNGNLATTISITSDIGWDISIDTIIYQGPA
jgi:hypothetical protein